MSGLKHISVGKDGTVWGAGKTDGTLFHRQGGLGYAWMPNKAGKADVVAVGGKDNVWCVNKDGDVFEWDGQGSKWRKDSGASGAKTISAGADGTVWYGKTDGALFRREGNAWHSVDGRAVIVAVGGRDNIWCVNKDGEVFEWDSQGSKWRKDSGASGAKTISVGADGTVWYGKTDGTLFCREGTAWHSVDGRATVVAVGGKGNVWCVNNDGDAFQLTTQNTWHKVDQPKGSWEYTVKQNDGLYAIVRQQYHLTDEKEVRRIGDLIAKDNHIQNKDRLVKDTVLNFQSY